jgi:hypothetical protein
MTTTPKKTTRTRTTKPKATAKPKAETKPQTTPVDLPPNPFMFEVLEVVSSQRTKAKKIEFLKKYEHDSLKSIFIWNFDETVISMLPGGDVPYADANEQSVYSGTLSENIGKEIGGGASAVGQDLDSTGRTSLRREFRNLYHYVKHGNDGLTAIRRETMFISLLRSLHPKEAEIVILTKDKKLQDKYKITKEIVSEAYPDIRWGGRS